ncbi:MAG: hypothetical protein H7Y38_05390, partial [Armatimonadetes bacterium]|nr:hypothetical protein [Armatimonadota bacterium]
GEHKGGAPATLAELTTGANPYLQTVPTDLLSPSGAEPLRYNARTGTVYSVGENGKDEGATGDDDLKT